MDNLKQWLNKKKNIALGINIPYLNDKTFVILLIVLSALYLLLLNGYISSFVDNTRYMVAAKSLLMGNGFNKIHSVTNAPQTLYPPGYPIILMILMFFFSMNIIVFKLFSILAVFLAMFFFFKLLRRFFDFSTAAIITTAAALSPLIYRYSAVELSESVFLFFSVLTLFLFEKSTDKKNGYLYLIPAILAGVSMYYIRSAGIVLIPAVMIFYLIRKDYKKALIFILVFGILIAPWVIRGFTVKSAENGTYFKQFMWKDMYNTRLGKIGVLDLFKRLYRNAFSYSTLGLGNSPLLERLPINELIPLFIGFLISLTILTGFFSRITKKLAIVEIYVFFYFGLNLLWQCIDIRFLHPIFPFIVMYFLIGASVISTKLSQLINSPKLAKYMTSAVVIIVIILSLQVDAIMAVDNLTGKSVSSSHKNFYKANEWLKTNSPKQSIILSIRPEITYLLSGRKSENYLNDGYKKYADYYFNLATQNNYDYVIIDTFAYSIRSRKYLTQAILEDKVTFQQVYGPKDNGVRIFKVQKIMPKDNILRSTNVEH